MKLTSAFYERNDVVKIARELIGKQLFTQIGGVTTGGMIVETEAYSWREKGCHAFGGRMTNRNEIMFATGGHCYVYLCYGIHNLFNVVTNKEGKPEAVLIRAIEPVVGVTDMKIRRGSVKNLFQLTSGPGKLTNALGIDRTFNGKFLLKNEVWIEDSGIKFASSHIECSPRIGIDYAGEDAKLPWRFTLKESKWVSKT